MADGFHSMLQSRGALGSLGPPSTGGGNPMGAAYEIANRMKNEDMRRQRELMQFQQQMRIMDEQRARQNAEMDRNRIDITGRKANKNYVTQYAPPPLMQQQWRQDEIREDQQRQALEIAKTQGDMRLQQALATAGLANERNAASIAGRASEGALNRESREGIAEESRKVTTAGQNKPFTITDPNNPNNQIAVMLGSDGKLQRVTLDDQGVGPLTGIGKPFKPDKIQGMTPEQLEGVRQDARDAKKALDLLLDPKTGGLTEDAAYASGWSNLTRGLEYLPTPQQAGASKFDQLKSKLVLSLIQKMKAASKTGATGFGALNIKELTTLENAATRAAAGKGDKANLEALKEVGEMLDRMLEDSDEEKVFKQGGTMPRRSSFTPAAAPTGGTSKLAEYAGQSISPSEYQPGQGRLPITTSGSPTVPAQTLRPQAAESLNILNRNRTQPVDTGVPVWQGSR